MIETMVNSMPLPFSQAVVAGYTSHCEAETALHLLAAIGLPMDKISIVGRNFKTRGGVQGFYCPRDPVLEGTETGAWFGGLLGLLVGTGLFILTAVGPVFVLGPLARLVAGGINDGGAGALVNGLIAAGVSRDHALKYQERLQAGEFLVVVSVGAGETARACEILEGTAQTHLQTHGGATEDRTKTHKELQK